MGDLPSHPDLSLLGEGGSRADGVAGSLPSRPGLRGMLGAEL